MPSGRRTHLPQLAKKVDSPDSKIKKVDLRPLRVFASEKLPDSALRDAILSQTQDSVSVETFLTILPIYLRLMRRIKP
jgi:hypothetical protein